MKTQDYIREFITIFFMRKKTIAGIMLGAVMLGVLIVLFWPPVYRAEGALILKGSNVLQPQGNLGDINAKLKPLSEEDLFSEMEILKSQDVVRGAVTGLAGDERFGVDPEKAATTEALVKKVQASLSASLIPRSNVIQVGINWADPEEATTILSSIFEEYLNRRQAVFNPKEAEDFFKTQVESFRTGLDDLENNLLEATGGASVDDIEDRLKRNVDLEHDLRKELNSLESKRVEQANHVQYLEQALKEKGFNFFTAIDSLELADFAKKIEDVLIQLEERRKIYDPTSPEVQRTREQLDRLYDVFHAEAKRYIEKERHLLEGIEEQMDSVQERLAKLQAENRELYANVLEARRLGRETAVMEESYKTFATRFREAKIRNETQSDRLFSVGIVERAHASASPVFPNAGRVLPTSVFLGLLLGVTVGFIGEFFDHRFKRPEDVSNYTGLPYLFSVPAYR